MLSAGAEQPVLSVEPLYEKLALRSFIVPPAAGGIGIYIMAPRAPYLPSGTVLHTSRGRSPQPVREASAGPGQNPWRPGPKARRRHQPSRRKTTVGRLNGRTFYGQAKGQLRPTCTSYAGCAHQPSGIQVSADSSQRPMTSNVAHSKKALVIRLVLFQLISSFLSSRAASSQVLSAFVSLTTVFGMGTGVSSQLSPLNL